MTNPTSNLVTRLREALQTRTWVNLPEDIAEAADEIERLHAANKARTYWLDGKRFNEVDDYIDEAERQIADLKKQLSAKHSSVETSTVIDWPREVEALLDGLGLRAVRVREGGGPENLAASLAVTVARLCRDAAARGSSQETTPNQDGQQTPAPSGHAGLGTTGRASSPGQSPGKVDGT